MSRYTVYLSEADTRFIESVKGKFGSVSKVIRYSLKEFQKAKLKEYYLQKSETYPELDKAQTKVIRQQEKEEQL